MLRLWVGIVCLMGTLECGAVEVVFSANTSFGLDGGGVTVQGGGLIAFDPANLNSGRVPFDFPGNLDAVHILNDGDYLVSYHSEVTIGGLTFDDQHVVRYDVDSDTTTSFHDYSGLFEQSSEADIDAFFLLPNGHHVFSNVGDARIGGLDFSDMDLVEFDPSSGAVSLFFDGDLIEGGDRFNNLTGASLVGERQLALSVATGGVSDMTLGGVTFQRNDIIVYDLDSGIASTLVDGDIARSSPKTPAVSAIHIGPSVVVPEPHNSWLLGVLVVTAILRQRARAAA